MGRLTDAEAWEEFRDWVQMPDTWTLYDAKVKLFILRAGFGKWEDAVPKVPPGAAEVVRLAKSDPDRMTKIIKRYLIDLRDNGNGRRDTPNGGKLSPASLVNHLSPIRTFLTANKAEGLISWKHIWKVIPKRPRSGQDRAPTTDEVKRLLEDGACDLRARAAILIMLSSGVRVGAFHFPKAAGGWGFMEKRDIEPVPENGEVVAARLSVYRGEPEAYTTFITREAWDALQAYFGDREARGEKIGPESYVLRDKYVRVRDRGYQGAAGKPRALTRAGLKSMLDDLEKAARVRGSKQGNRFEWKESHGFRKWMKSRLREPEAKVDYAAGEMFLGHGLPNRDAYDKFTLEELQTTYLRAAPFLTVYNEHNKTLAKEEQVEKLELEIEALKEQMLPENVAKLFEQNLIGWIKEVQGSPADQAAYVADVMKRIDNYRKKQEVAIKAEGP